MLKAVINDIEYIHFTMYELELKYNSIASTFALTVNKGVIKGDLDYKDITIYLHGRKVLTGHILPITSKYESIKGTIKLVGYSSTGSMEISTIPESTYPLIHDGYSLLRIAERLSEPFGVKVGYSVNVSSDVKRVFETTEADYTTTVKQYLSMLSSLRNVILTHDVEGNLYFTRYLEGAQRPVASFVNGYGIQNSTLRIPKDMHQEIIVIRQASYINPSWTSGSQKPFKITNPYVKKYSSKTIVMADSDHFDGDRAVRNALNEELSGIMLQINTTKFVMPGQLVEVKIPDHNINDVTEFMVKDVNVVGDSKEQERYTLTCVLPQVFGDGEVKNIFE